LNHALLRWFILSAAIILSGRTHAAPLPATSEVPFELGGKVMFLKATINGKGPYRLILDTGATETVITPPVAKALGVRTTPVTAAQSKGVVPSLAVGGAAVTNFGVYVFDPPQAIALRLDAGLDYHGLLGYTFISRFLTTVDYGRNRVRFDALPSTAKRPTQTGPITNIVAFEIVEHLIRVPVRINGGGPFLFLLDTGAAEVLLFPPTARALNLPAPTPGAPAPTFPELKSVTLGQTEVRQIRGVVDSQADPRVSANFAGILGYPFLSRFAVTINYRDKILVLIVANAPVAQGRPGT
jgi:predicted aspartyl protease